MGSLRQVPRQVAVGGLACAAVVVGGCSFTPSRSWTDQLSPSGPCYTVNLLDGINTEDTGELHALFACLDAGGGLAGFRPVDLAWDTPTRDGDAGLVLARWLAALDTEGVSFAALLEQARALLEDPTSLWDAAHLGLELVYGVPWSHLAEHPLAEPASLEGGLLAPAQVLVGDVAGLLLDAPEVTDPLVVLLRSEDLRRVAWTLTGVVRSPEAPMVVLVSRGPDDVAALLAAVRSPENDRSPEATGNSLEDLLVRVLVRQESDGRPTWQHLSTPALPLLADAGAGAALVDALGVAVETGDLARVPGQIPHLLSVDAHGAPRAGSTLSALASLVRLLRNGNTEVSCTLDLGFTEVDLDLGNLSVSLLTTFAGLDPRTAESGVALFGDLLGVSLTDDALQLIADSGACPVIDDTFVSDLAAIDRLTDPEADAVLPVLIGVLGAFDQHIPEVVDTLSVAWDLGLWLPVEDLLVDVVDGPLIADLMPVVPALLDPAGWYDGTSFPAEIAPVDGEALWSWAGTLLDPSGPVPTLQPLLDAVVDSRSTWLLAERLGTLLAEPEAEIRGILPRLADAVEADPDLGVARDLADRLEDPAGVRPILVLAEAAGLRGALMVTTPTEPGPVPTVAGWAVDGTLDRALGAVRSLLHLLDPESP